ncbi:T9SS type A sorting domain-containing protein [bacterium]|nr:T9SS type A sorting domain-containing protein [bacterium]
MRLGAIILSLLISFTAAQDGVDWVPESPVQGGQITIYYNLESRDILPAETNPVYLHLGFDDWNNTTDYAMSKNTDDVWEYELSIPQDVTVIDFAFTDDTTNYNTANWDNNGGYRKDWHIDVYAEGLSVIIVSPNVVNTFGNLFRSPKIISQNEILPIIVTSVTTGIPVDSLILNINNIAIFSTNADTLKYNFNPINWITDRFEIQCIGKDLNGFSDTSEFAVVVRPDQISEKPTSNLIPGINQVANRGVGFRLFAPYKEYVYLIGDFNNWEVDNDYFMKKYEVSPDSVLWWFGIPIANLGNFAYQYLVDGEIRIADPYSEFILDPWNDKYIPLSVFPNLPEYPDGKTSEAVSYLEINQTTYDWQNNDDFTKLEQKDLVIYELLIRDFIKQHDYKTLIDTLDYLQKLGVNAIELMPINEFEGNSSWGYNPSFYFSPDKYYGPKNDLKAFIDECHRRGIAVMQDIVLNHSYGQSPLVRLYWDDVNNRPADNNPWYNKKSPNTTYSWGYDFNHESEHTKYFVDRVLCYWIEQYNIDGFRLDFTKGFTNKGGDGGSYDASRIAILKRIADAVWSYAPMAYLILEHFGDNVEEKELADHGFMLWGNSNHNYNEATMGFHDVENNSIKSDFSWGFYKSRGWTKPNLVTYMESHDEERLMYKNLNYGNSSSDYSVKNLETALERQKLAAAFFFTLPGPKMIWQFGELGYDISIDYNGRVGEKPIRWYYFNDADRRELYNLYSQLINMRNKNEVFTSPNTTVELSLNNSNGLKRIGLSHPSTSVIIIGNFGVTTQSINPQFFYTATWYDDINGVELEVTDQNAEIELAPGEFRIFTNKHLLALEDENDNTNGLPVKFSLDQNYPNPFNPVTTIKYTVPSVETLHATSLQLKIYNILGNEIATLVDEVKPSGEYEIEFDGTSFSNGIYFYSLSISDKILTKKMLLLK